MSREYVLQTFRPPVDLKIDYARELNEQQHAAVTALPGPSLVIAGAGSGKTRTLTYRVAFLLEQGIPPDRILLLTFTNKAAREMMRRVADLLGHELPELWGGTFHSVGARILRRNAELLGYRKDFTILDREDATELLKACIADANIDVKATRFPKADVVANIISMALNTSRSLAEVIAQEYDFFTELTPQLEDVRKRYAGRKQSGNVMDFDDLLVLWLKLLRDHEETRERFQRKFQFVLVDEYQDTNKLQAELIDLLGARHGNVMAVGDDSQSIYSWRGANFRNILEFPKRYPNAKIYKIETNYRSTPEILAVANAAISENKNQFAKELTAAKKSGTKPVLVACMDGAEQAAFVAQRVLELREEGHELNNMAVLYRSHFHALELQLEFTRRNIPFSITSGIRFFEQAHIKDVAAFLKLVINPADELPFKRVVQMLPGVGGKGASKLWQKFCAEWGARAPDASTPVAAAFQKCLSAVPKKAEAAWTQLAITLSQIEVEPVRSQPSEMIRLVLEAVYEEYLQDTFPNYRARLEDIQQLATFAQQFQSTEDFLTQLSLLTNVEATDDKPDNKDSEQIRLSTIHQAKGLEFDVVFVIMLCDGLFPSARSIEAVEGLEEERRLFYVAITRAKDELYLSYPLMRMIQGSYGDSMQMPSRFLGEIPPPLIEEWNLRSYDSLR
jgi:DNA helicase II / ATP-dependent DNA helicase PcrA